MRKLLFWLLASILLVILSFAVNTVVIYANRQNRLDEIKTIIEEVID